QIIGAPLAQTAKQCHGVSLAIVRSGRIPGARVARGTCRGVPGQHSWEVVGVWHGMATNDGRHVPHGGHGSIWGWGKPTSGDGPPIDLTPTKTLSRAARVFLDLLGPLDRRGWAMLAEAPVLGWPAAEIIAAMDDTADLRTLVPIDRLGMLTDRNPCSLY